MPTIFIPKEIVAGETRVAAFPDTVKKLVKEGFKVLVEAGAGVAASVADKDYEAAGAAVTADPVASYAEADVAAKFHPPRFHETLGRCEADLLKEGAVLIAFLWPLENAGTVGALAARRVTAFAMDMIPRISRAQSMDALSSQANIAGYKAVLLAAARSPRLFPLMMTPAGTISPAKVVILGAGVAGLQAVATARRLGAVVEVSDVRPAVKEQVMSLGAKFIEVPTDETMQDAGGYAREATPEFLARQQEIVRKHLAAADVVITTALVPGRPAPRLIAADVVRDMRPGTVIVDIAAERGGNCELTRPGEERVENGVVILGPLNLPGTVAYHASLMYSKNVLSVVQHLFKKGVPALDPADEINAGAFVTHAGEIRNPKVAELVAAARGGK